MIKPKKAKKILQILYQNILMLFALAKQLLDHKATICFLKPLILKTFGFLDHSGRYYAILTSEVGPL